MRADARRNREQIIVAATQIFAAEGLEVAMEAIARQAGVGVGTLYRRFPDRSELIAAVAAHNFRAVIADIQDVLATESAPWGALVRLFTRSESLRLTVRLAFGSPSAWEAVHAASESRDVHAEMMAALDGLVHSAQADGSVRTDIGSGDALFLASFVLGARASADPLALMRSQRAVLLVLDGLRANPGTPLPGSPIILPDLS